MALTIEMLLKESAKDRETRLAKSIQEERAGRLAVLAEQQGKFLQRWNWSRFYTVTYRFKKMGFGIEKVARAIHDMSGAERSFWTVERFKGTNELHLHGLDYAPPDIVRPSLEEVQVVCNKRYGDSLIKEVYSGGSCGYISKMSGTEWANSQYLGKWQPA